MSGTRSKIIVASGTILIMGLGVSGLALVPRGGLAPGPPEPRPVESYAACAGWGEPAPCISTDVTGTRYSLWLADVTRPYSPLVQQMPPCAAEDGHGSAVLGCVWDSQTRGDGTAGHGVKRFIVIRD